MLVPEAPSLQIGYTKHLAILLSLGALAAKGASHNELILQIQTFH